MREQDRGDDYFDPWERDITIEYWVWRDDHDDHFAPATPDAAGIQEDAWSRRALRHRSPPQTRALRTARRMQRRRTTMYAPLMGCPPLVISWLLARHTPRRVADKEGAHAKRSVTR
jgi:hypothetical protein